MKSRAVLVALAAVLACCGCRNLALLPPKTTAVSPEEAALARQCCYQFLKDAGHYFIATEEGDQPRVRPFGTIHIFEDKLYVQTGRRKNVGQQLLANGKVELCALKDQEWIRISGVLVDDPRTEARASMLDEYVSLKSMYSAEDENTMVLYFLPGTGTATIYSFQEAPKVMHF